MQSKKLFVQVLGDRDYPEVQVKLNDVVVGDFAEIVRKCKLIDPASTPESVIRSIWRHGSDKVCDNIAAGRQSGKGSIAGRVPDPRKAVVVDVPVTQ